MIRAHSSRSNRTHRFDNRMAGRMPARAILSTVLTCRLK
jgi:hypothetical protein